MSHADYVEAVRAAVEAELGIPVLAHVTPAPRYWSMQTAWHSVGGTRLQFADVPASECAASIARAFKLAMASDANRLDDWEAYDQERRRSAKEQR